MALLLARTAWDINPTPLTLLLKQARQKTLAEALLRPVDDAVLGLQRQLGEEGAVASNPHTFRRTFACLLGKACVDSLTIKGSWQMGITGDGAEIH